MRIGGSDLNLIVALGSASLLMQAAAGDAFDASKPEHILIIDEALQKTARYCVESFGFTRSNHPGPMGIQEKIRLEFRISGHTKHTMARWLQFTKAMTIPRQSDGLSLVGAGAILSATIEPGNYEPAEKRWVDAAIEPMNESIAACRAGAKDAFIQTNYWSGDGSTDSIVAELKKMFAEAVRGSEGDATPDGTRALGSKD